MKVFILNDTSGRVHAGSDAVMRNLQGYLSDHDIVGRHRVGDMSVTWAAIEDADWVIANGEGTIHDDQKEAVFILESLSRAQRIGKRTALVNTIFENMSERFIITLKRLDLFTVRDPWSREQAERIGCKPDLFIDMCIDEDTIGGGTPRHRGGVYKGGAHGSVATKGRFFRVATKRFLDRLPYERLTLQGRFEDVVADLREARLYITGQYHGVCAAGAAGAPFVALPGNSHKLEALLAWSRLPIALCRSGAQVEEAISHALDNQALFVEFGEFVRSRPRHSKAFFNRALT